MYSKAKSLIIQTMKELFLYTLNIEYARAHQLQTAIPKLSQLVKGA